ncbi:MAG: hypothetical protein RI953_2850 [Pseudomonadota bacterium]|jgi:ABC-type multidrug transport system ATPase subunit
MNLNALTLEKFSFSYDPSRTPLLFVEDLRIDSGETVALVGRNGSGKSTLLMSLAGLLKPQSGSRTSSIPQANVAFVFQTPCLDKKLTVHENLTLFGKIWGMSNKAIESKIEALNPSLHLQELLKKTVNTLSGGQQRRADLARALLVGPQVLFLDEPTTGLDLIAQREFWSVLAETRKTNPQLTIVCATHHSAELGLFGRFVFIDAGRINAYVDQSALLSMLPRETLEVNTRDSAENLVHALGQEQNLKTSIVAHDKVVIHSHDAASALERIKNRETLGAQMESVLIRKTSLSDALWQILSQTSNETAIDDRAGVTR